MLPNDWQSHMSPIWRYDDLPPAARNDQAHDLDDQAHDLAEHLNDQAHDIDVRDLAEHRNDQAHDLDRKAPRVNTRNRHGQDQTPDGRGSSSADDERVLWQLKQLEPAPRVRRGLMRFLWFRLLLVLLAPLAFPLFLLVRLLLVLRPASEWIGRNLDDRGPHSFWGPPKAGQIQELLRNHGCYYLHGPLGSGKTMGTLVLGLLMAWHQATQHDEQQYLFCNFTVYDYRCRLLLYTLGCPGHILDRITIEQFSVMDQTAATHHHVWRRRFAVICADELPYYMEEDKKTVRSLLLRAFRMARRRQQIVLGVGQELIHSRYRPLFRLRGQCGMSYGLMRIVWRGAQDPVDSKRPTKPQAVTRYGLDVRRIAACYDTWEDLEDLDDDAPPTAAPARLTRRSA